MKRSLAVRVVLVVAVLVVSYRDTQGEERRSVETEAVAVVGGVPVGSVQLEDLARDQLRQVRSQEYEIKRRVLDQHVERVLLEQEAAARKLSVEELSRLEIEAKAIPPTEEQARARYEAARSRLKDVSEERALQEITNELRRRSVAQRRAEFVAELRARRGVRILLEPFRLPVEAGDGPSKGPTHAPVTIVEFSDFQCPYCSSVLPTLKKIEERYGDKVRIVFRDFPLPTHTSAPKAAEAAACAEDQGRFWQMHDKLFAGQQSLQPADLERYAGELGLKQDVFKACLDSGRYAARVRRGMADAAAYGVKGTPSFFVNGRLLSGARPFEAFAEVIDEELERVGATAGGCAGCAPGSGR